MIRNSHREIKRRISQNMRRILFNNILVFFIVSISSTDSNAQEYLEAGWRSITVDEMRIEVPVHLIANGLNFDNSFEATECGQMAKAVPALQWITLTFHSIGLACSGEELPEIVTSDLLSERSKITYSKNAPDFSIVSGFADGPMDMIFYNACKRSRDSAHCFFLMYPSEFQEAVGPFIERMFSTLK